MAPVRTLAVAWVAQVGALCRRANVNLVSAGERDHAHKGEWDIITDRITLGGGLHDLLRFTQAWEQVDGPPARLVSFELNTRHIGLNNGTSLYATLTFRSVAHAY